MRHALTFFALLGAWFALGHLLYWFIVLEWSWMNDWGPVSRGTMLAIGLYISGCATFLIPKVRRSK